ncbi:MFS transporter [Streptomyces noursei]|uniref:MFS transporter n=1 Tax=Streptomyces noursei TaxID=1971 RepID=UPI0037F7C937
MAPAQQAAPRARQPGQPDRMPFVLVTAGFWSASDRFAMTTVLVAIADGLHTTSVTYAGDIVPADAVKRALSPFYAGGGLGVAAGIALGGIIVSAASWRYVFVLPAVAALVLVAATGGRLSTVVVAAALLGGGWMFTNTSLANRAATVLPQVRGTMVSLYVTGMFVGGGVAPALATGPADRGEYSVLFLTGACVAVLVTLLASLSDLRLGARSEAGRAQQHHPVSESERR